MATIDLEIPQDPEFEMRGGGLYGTAGDPRTPLRSAMPPLSNDAEFFPGLEKHYGYGFQVNAERAPTGLSAGSLMWAGMANSFYWIDPAKNIGGVYLTRILPFADVKSAPLFMDFQKAVYQSMG